MVCSTDGGCVSYVCTQRPEIMYTTTSMDWHSAPLRPTLLCPLPLPTQLATTPALKSLSDTLWPHTHHSTAVLGFIATVAKDAPALGKTA